MRWSILDTNKEKLFEWPTEKLLVSHFIIEPPPPSPIQLMSLGDLDSSVGILLQVKCGIWMDKTSNFHIEFVDSNWIMILAAAAYKLGRSNLAVGI